MKKLTDYLKTYCYGSILKRLLLLVFPIILMPLGISCYYACKLGADPFSVFVDGEHVLSGFSYGQITTVNNVVLLSLLFIFGRKYINLGTIITSFTAGPLIDLFRTLIVTNIKPESAGIMVQGMILVIGCVLFSIGVGIYIAINLGIGAVEFVSLFIAEKLHVKLKYVRIVLDALFVVTGYLMGGIIGFGTILGVLATGPIVEFTLMHLKKPIDNFAGNIKVAIPKKSQSLTVTDI